MGFWCFVSKKACVNRSIKNFNTSEFLNFFSYILYLTKQNILIQKKCQLYGFYPPNWCVCCFRAKKAFVYRRIKKFSENFSPPIFNIFIAKHYALINNKIFVEKRGTYNIMVVGVFVSKKPCVYRRIKKYRAISSPQIS